MERGRERRICTIIGGANFQDEFAPNRRWTALGGAVRVVTERTLRYYITNLSVETGAARVAERVRGHWGIENSLHWVLDDIFQEDRCHLHTGHVTRNMATCGASP